MADTTVTTNELMDFLQEHMVTKGEFDVYKEENKQEMNSIRQEMKRMKLDLIDNLDEKLVDFNADLVLLMRKGDHKFVALVDELAKNNVLDKAAVERILAMSPFPR